ncbi:putative uncharacterized protein [Mycoplasma sp. CAG:776]|nr:putative uncharacterized protein [Mycoplasma sp. CAG:776]
MEDLFYLLLGVAVIVLPIYFIVKKVKNRGHKEKVVDQGPTIKELKEKKEIVKEKKVKVLKLKDIKHIEGISSLREEEDCALNVDDEEFTVITKIGNFNISLDRIVNAGIMSKKEMETKNKSVFARSLVGSMVGLGALGALSGIGQKVKNYYSHFLIINYRDKNTEEIKLLVFGLGKYDGGGQLFVNKLTKRLSNEKVDIDL